MNNRRKKPTEPQRRGRHPRPADRLRAKHKAPAGGTAESSSGPGIRLQRFLAAAGCGSRRQCETFIAEGRVEVDGQVVTQLGTKVDPDSQHVSLDGESVRTARLSYFAVHKPPGVLSTSRDPSGRTRVIDLIPSDQRLYNVGRLDKSSEGLILVTNDGDLAQRLTHPKFGIEKKYLVLVVGHPHRDQLDQLERGVHLAEGLAKASRAEIKKRAHGGTWLEITLQEGRNREIRRLLARLGHKVIRLIRVAVGPVQLGALAVGEHRKLTAVEVQRLKSWKPPRRPDTRQRRMDKRSPS